MSEYLRPKPHKNLFEVVDLATHGCSSKIAECILNGDLAELPEDLVQRIMSLALVNSGNYSIDCIIPMTDTSFLIESNFVRKREERLLKLNFRMPGRPLKEVIKSLYNGW